MLVGHIKEIVRHPVKSLRGESVNKTKVMDYGLYGDRSHAFVDESNQGKFLTITQLPELVHYKARFSGDESEKEFPKVEITTPEGKVVSWQNEDLLEEIQDKANRKISQISYKPSHVPFGAIEEENILLVTDSSVNELNHIWGSEVDFRRFRPNIFIDLLEKQPFIEETWFQKRMKIGKSVELQIKRHCERCMIITVHPENGERDSSLLQTLVKERDNCFGVYASVIKTGNICVGDEVVILDDNKS